MGYLPASMAYSDRVKQILSWYPSDNPGVLTNLARLMNHGTLAGTGKLVILMTKGIDSELSSVAFTLANGALTAGLEVSVFLTSAAVDLVRRGGQGLTHVPPLSPLAELIADFQARGGTIWACPPCAQARGYAAEDLLDGVTLTGASAMFTVIKDGGATLSF